MKRHFAEAVWHRLKAQGVDLRVVPSIGEQRTFVRDIADRRDEVEGETKGIDED